MTKSARQILRRASWEQIPKNRRPSTAQFHKPQVFAGCSAQRSNSTPLLAVSLSPPLGSGAGAGLLAGAAARRSRSSSSTRTCEAVS
jgi:hypothetical protein